MRTVGSYILVNSIQAKQNQGQIVSLGKANTIQEYHPSGQVKTHCLNITVVYEKNGKIFKR